MDPINYLAAFPQEDFLRDIQGGLQLGQAYRQAQQQQQQQQLAQQQAQQYQADVQDAMSNPTPQAFSTLALKYPAQRDAIKQSWDGLSAGDQKTEGDTMAQAYSALLAGKPDVAKQVVQTQIDARKNSGLDTSHYDNALSLLDADPKQAQGALGFALSHITDPKTFAQTFGSLQGEQRTADAAPAELTKKQADAASATAGVVGQTLGSLQGKNAKPAQAITAIKSLQARGLLSPDDAQALQDSVPTDPKALDDWFGQQRAAGMKTDDQQKYTTPDANAQLSARTQVQTTGMNNSTQLAVQDHIDARQKDDSTVKHGALGLNDSQNEALFGPNGAVATGKLDPNRINSRTAALYADAFLKNPNMDMAKISGDIALGRNATFRQNAMTAEVLPEIMQNMVDAGKKLKFSDNRTLGKMQGWVKGEVNDPDMVEYMTQRNDALMTVARVMRGAGMTDMAHKAETEVSAPTMSPDALDAWMRGQMKSLQPRLNINRKITRDGQSAPTASAGGAHPSDISALLKKYGGG